MRPLRTLVACLTAAVLAAVMAAPAASAPQPFTLGVSLPSYHYDPGAVTAYEGAIGEDVALVQTFISWQYTGQPSWSDFPTGRARQIAATGAQLEVTWVPSNPSRGASDPQFSLASIARGDHDAYVARFAKAVKSYGEPVRIRFGHEMNGNWTPYNEARSGNSSGQFVAAWRHVHDVVAAAGASNVTWVWSPNIVSSGTTPLTGLYPGDAFVDEVGIDGYSYPKVGCPSPSRLFSATLAQVRGITAKPVRFAEVGVATTCPNRAAWITNLSRFERANGVAGHTWWERTSSGYDTRLVPSAELVAYRTAIGTV